MIEFKCVFCETRHPADPMAQFCPDCGEPMLVDLPARKREIRRGRTPLARFLDFLPFPEVDGTLLLGEGDTPLLTLGRLSERFRLPRVLAKNEMANPTASFKDRGTVAALHAAKAWDHRRIGTVSTGNMAASTAAYAARAGMDAYVLVREDTTEEKLLSTAVLGAKLIRVSGDYGELWHRSYSLGKKHGIYFMNSVDPFRVEGYKAAGFEIFESLAPKGPRHVIVPVSSGGHLIGLMKAFSELKEQGLCPEVPAFVGVQAEGCSPIARAFASGSLRYSPAASPQTLAQSIANPSPPGGNIALRMIRALGGEMLSVTDEEILAAQKLLAEEEGLFCLPASATTLAGLLKLKERGRLVPDESAVLVLTGSGLKNIHVLPSQEARIFTSGLPDLDRVITTLTG